jgi:hypothetical protein
MAQSCGKNVNDFLRLSKTERYLAVLSNKTGFPVMAQNQGFQALVEITKGGDVENAGTWGHPKVAIRFAQWCSEEFAIQVDTWIEELLMTGKVELVREQKTTGDALVEMALAYREQERRLSQVERTVLRHNAELDRVSFPDGHYFTILGYANVLGVRVGSDEAKLLGRKAAIASRAAGVEIKRVRDAKYGHINSYLDTVLENIFAE